MLLTFAQVEQPHIAACMVAGQIQAMDPHVVVLHNMISSAYKEEKAKSLLPASHFRSLVAHQWSMRGAIFMSAVIEHLAG